HHVRHCAGGPSRHPGGAAGARSGRRMKDRAMVEKVIRDALRSVRSDGAEIDPRGELGLDSTQALELVMEIEERLDISIPVETLADARTFDQLCAGILRLDA